MLGILYRVCISSLLNILHLDISPPLRRYFPRRWLGWSLLAPGPDQDCPTLPTGWSRHRSPLSLVLVLGQALLVTSQASGAVI